MFDNLTGNIFCLVNGVARRENLSVSQWLERTSNIKKSRVGVSLVGDFFLSYTRN